MTLESTYNLWNKNNSFNIGLWKKLNEFLNSPILKILLGHPDTLLPQHPALIGAAIALSIAYLLLPMNTCSPIILTALIYLYVIHAKEGSLKDLSVHWN